MPQAHDVDNYTLGKGIVYFDQLVGGVNQGELDLGNAPAVTLAINLDTLEHFSSRGGLRAKDKRVVSEITPVINFTLDELTSDNFALLFMADVTEVNQAAASVAAEAVTARHDRWVKLANRMVTSGTVVIGAYTEGTDYEVDYTVGRIKVLSTGTITDGQVLSVAYDCVAYNYKQIKMLAQTDIEGALRFVSDNPVGPQMELVLHKVSLTPAGETAFIGDDWSTLEFNGEILKDETGHPNSPYGDIIMDGELVVATTTTTTT
jgi:hypothetical protein